MTPPPRSRYAQLVAAAAAALVFALLSSSFADLARTDPDRAYHHALDRIAADHFLVVTSVPQVTGLHWDIDFVDKELLFHAAGGLAFRLLGDDGADAMRLLFGALAIFLAVVAVPRAKPLVAAAVVAVVLVAPPEVFARLVPLRPHVLAMCCLLALVGALLRRRAGLAFAAGLAFSLSYHAFYVPLAVAAAGLVFHRRDPGARRAFLLGGAGVVVGLVTTPFFPRNLTFVVEIVQLALAGARGSSAVVAESTRLPLLDWLASFGFLALVVVVAAALALRRRTPALSLSADLAWLLTSAAGLLVLSLLNPRAIEYAAPLTAVAAVAAAHALVDKPERALAALFLAAVPCLAPSALAFAREDQSGLVAHLDDLDRAVQTLPDDNDAAEVDALVFSCDTYANDFVLWRRPHLRVVDALEPELLERRDPALAQARAELRAAKDAAAIAAVLEKANARFLLCDDPRINSLAQHSPSLVELFPAGHPIRRSWIPPPGLFRVERR